MTHATRVTLQRIYSTFRRRYPNAEYVMVQRHSVGGGWCVSVSLRSGVLASLDEHYVFTCLEANGRRFYCSAPWGGQPDVLVPRSQLGQVVGAVLHQYDAWLNDPMNECCGFTPDPTWGMQELARAHGWTLRDIEMEMDARGVSHRWQYFNWPHPEESAA